MAEAAWPELESSTTTKAPEWALRTESELHVERLEAKLESIKKKDKTHKASRQPRHENQLQDVEEPDAEEIQGGQEEADEGLWLLWNAQRTSLSPSEAGRRPASSSKQPLLSGGGGSSSYGTREDAQTDREARIRIPRSDVDGSDSESESESEADEDEDEEDRLEQAKAQAKDADEYLVKDHRHCRTCCIIS
ncbi:hypothetical protein BGX29_008293 [Mortierella sp. GBA35]|nr:hypothetical protein BGX29_008293 [Mortierella sp. GBA35]